MNTNLLIAWLSFMAVFLLIMALDLLRGQKSILGKYIDGSTGLYDFAENISMFVPDFADELKKDELQTKLTWSGDILGVSTEGYYALRIILAVLGFVVVLLLYPFGISPVLGVLAGAGLSYLPVLAVQESIKKRQEDITLRLPDMVNLLSISVSAGVELSHALESVSSITEGALGEVMRSAWRETATGKSRADSLKQAARDTGVEMFERFVDTIVVAEERGGMEISKSLADFSLDMRDVQRSYIEEQKNLIPTKMNLPLILCIFIPMLILLLTPVLLQLVDSL